MVSPHLIVDMMCVQEAARIAEVLFSTSHCESMHVADPESVFLLS